MKAHERVAIALTAVDVVKDGFDLVVRDGSLQNWPGLAGRRVANQHMRVCAARGYLGTASLQERSPTCRAVARY